MIVGIDFGTCFSSVAVMRGATPVTTYTNRIATVEGIPTRFMYSKLSNVELYGKDTKRGDAYKNPKDVVKNIKRTIRENPDYLKIPVVSGDKEFLLAEVIERFIRYLIDNTKKGAQSEVENTDIEAIAITVPVGIRSDQVMSSDYNQLIFDIASKITGLPDDKIKILEEPVAASISYFYGENLRSQIDSSQSILVFDLGGGTLDVTIMSFDPDTLTFTTESKEGDLNLGGNDFDSRIAQRVLSDLGIAAIEDPEELSKFEDAVTKLKIELSEVDDSTIFFKNKGKLVNLDFTREMFENECKDLVDRCKTIIDKTLAAFPKGIAGIDKIVLVGGGSNMPMIRNMIESEYGIVGHDNILSHNPSTAISRGAAIYAQLTTEIDSNINVIPIISHTYGFDCLYHGGELRLYNLLFKGTPFIDTDRITAHSPSSFVAVHDDQTVVSYTLYETDYFVNPDDMVPYDDEYHWSDFDGNEGDTGVELTIPIPEEYLGRATQYSHFIELSINVNGLLEITITDSKGAKIGYKSNYKR